LILGVYGIARKTMPFWLALLSTCIAGFLLASAGFFSYAVFPALGFGLWAVLAWLYYLESCRRRWLILSGCLLGAASFIRWDIGIYTTLSVLCAGYLFLQSQNMVSVVQNRSRLDWKKLLTLKGLFGPLRTLLWMIGPFLAVVLLPYGYIGLRSGWNNLYEQVFYFPAVVLHSVRWLAYPPLVPTDFPPSDDWRRFYLPLLILIPALIFYVFTFLKRPADLRPGFFMAVALILDALLLFNQALSRYDYIHVIPASLVTFMVCALIFCQLAPRVKSGPLLVLIYLVLIVPTYVYFMPAYRTLRTTLDSIPPWGCYSDLQKANCVAVDQNQAKAVQYIQAHTRPTDAIFVGNQKHDRLFVNDVGFYYLADRPSVTRYDELHPGVATTLPVQTEIAGELESARTKWVVLVNIWDSNEPNGSAVSSGVHFLDDYLRAHFQFVDVFGIYQVFERRASQ
jgi:hypothetical protein